MMDDSRELIEFINKLQTLFKTTGCSTRKIHLPQIVVVGAQSSGKSSVLDGLVGFSILPRGSGTVTKCPIIVQLITINGDSENEGIELEDFPEVGRIKDYDEVREKITNLMEKNGGAITDTPIIVRVYSPDVVTLTVVDLPGIKRLTSKGEPSDLETLVFDLSRKYINEKNAIILAVSPANYDICNSDGLLLAKEADPEGNRTIGVLTKLDLMDEGTNARDLLTGLSTDIQVKLGMIGLVNRSQKDIDNNFSVEQQMEKEKMFLNNNYGDLVQHHGVPYLRKRLQELLVQHIVKCLPGILKQLEESIKHCDKRLAEIPNVMTKKDQLAFVNRIISRFEKHTRTEIEGSPRRPEYVHLYGGIKIKDLFQKLFASDMKGAVKASDKSITDAMIQTAFRNSGSYDSMFVNPESVFRTFAQTQLKHIEKPALMCAERVNDQIMKVVDRNLAVDNNHDFKHFPELRKLMKSVVTKILENNLDDVKTHIIDYIRVQSSVVFSLDDKFLMTVSSIRRKLEKQLYVGDEDSNEKLKEELSFDGFNGSQDNHQAMEAIQVMLPQRNTISPNGNGKIGQKPRLSNGSGSDRQYTKLMEPASILLIKAMVKEYFLLIKSQTQDYIPKLIADRLIMQFSSDGCLVEELRVKVLENYESLTQLPMNVRESRKKDLEFKQTINEAIGDVKGILNSNNYKGNDAIELHEDSDAEWW